MVSIVIAAYNEEKNITNCVRRICATDFDFEIIIVDDGSKDNTWEILKELSSQDERIHIYRQENKGCSAARNLGLDKVCGEWVTFVDADDEVLPSCVKLIDEIDINTNIIQGNQYRDEIKPEIFDESYRVFSSEFIQCVTLNRFKYLTIADESEKAVFDATHGAVGKLYRTDFINDQGIRFIEGLGLGEDMIFYLEALEHTDSVVASNKFIYKINENENSSTRRINPKMVGYAYEFIRQIVNFYNRYEKDLCFFNNMCYQIYNTISVGVTANILRENKSFINKREVFLPLYSIPKIKEYLKIAFKERMHYKEPFVRRFSQSIPIYFLSKGWIKVYLAYLSILQSLIIYKKRFL